MEETLKQYYPGGAKYGEYFTHSGRYCMGKPPCRF